MPTVDVDAIRAALGSWTHDCQRVIAALCDEVEALEGQFNLARAATKHARMERDLLTGEIERLRPLAYCEAGTDSEILFRDLVHKYLPERDAALAECVMLEEARRQAVEGWNHSLHECERLRAEMAGGLDIDEFVEEQVDRAHRAEDALARWRDCAEQLRNSGKRKNAGWGEAVGAYETLKGVS